MSAKEPNSTTSERRRTRACDSSDTASRRTTLVKANAKWR